MPCSQHTAGAIECSASNTTDYNPSNWLDCRREMVVNPTWGRHCRFTGGDFVPVLFGNGGSYMEHFICSGCCCVLWGSATKSAPRPMLTRHKCLHHCTRITPALECSPGTPGFTVQKRLPVGGGSCFSFLADDRS